MRFVDYYDVLQISPTASPEIIKVAYRQLSKMYHPDLSNVDDKKFILIKEAYEVLSDTYRRTEYDEIRMRNLRKENLHYKEKLVNKPRSDFSNFNPTGIKKPLSHNRWYIVGISFLIICMFFVFIFIIESSVSDSTYIDEDGATSEIYDISLPKEEYSKLKTNEHILEHGEAFFDIYNGTNLTITSITIEINVKNNDGIIIDTRQLQKDVNIDPLSVETEINITTGIEGLPAIGENDLRIQPKYISWSYIEVLGDKF
ncbi:J domain-containing protein [Planococcus sp. S3-L1]|uniref:J domain-containing protein n=1 Tax=Planococcus sp. S3-L1 TaxID=3046200 RepID=UPI0024BB85E8|nr:J domain-containing protein [Planococcus sp. S3-L1]MDJ0332282.1 J domain-containing protein [Planococcus sp. S3-L1]